MSDHDQGEPTMKTKAAARVIAAFLAATIASACASDGDTQPAATSVPTSVSAASAPPTSPPGSPSTTAANAAPSITTGGKVTYGNDGEAACFVPQYCTLSAGPGQVRGMVLEPLVKTAANAKGYDNVLIDSIEPNDDFTSFTATLKTGITFSDGTAFTATLLKTLFDDHILIEGSVIRSNVTQVDSVDAPDEETFVFHLRAPQAPFPAVLALVPIWKPDPALTKTSLPIGTGPFVFESWEPNVMTKLVRNTTYWDEDSSGVQLPYLDAIDVVPIAAGDTRVNALIAGDIDLAYTNDPLLLQQLAKEARATEPRPLDAGSGLFFNNSSGPTSDVRVRKGLAHGIDKDEILAAIGGGEVRNQYFAKASPYYSEKVAAATPTYDVDKARALLKEYIEDAARSDGEPAGAPLTIDIAYIAGSIAQESAALIAQQQWQDIGVTVTVTPKDQPTWIGDAISGNFDVNYFLWGTADPFNLFTRNYSHWPETKSNYTHFNSDALVALVAKLSVAGTSEEAIDLVEQIGMIIADGTPLVFLQSVQQGYGLSERIEHTQLDTGFGLMDWARVSVSE